MHRKGTCNVLNSFLFNEEHNLTTFLVHFLKSQLFAQKIKEKEKSINFEKLSEKRFPLKSFFD